jgi:hypothetical protein
LPSAKQQIVIPQNETWGERFTAWFSRLKASHWYVLATILVVGFGAGMWFEKRFPEHPDRATGQETPQPLGSPSVQLQVAPPATSPAPAITQVDAAAQTQIEMSVQEFSRKYAELEGRFTERETLLKEVIGKRVNWLFAFRSPATQDNKVVVQFDIPSEDGKLASDPALRLSPVRWALFPLSLHDRIYGLRPGDLITITGTVRELNAAGVFLDATNFQLLGPIPRGSAALKSD